MTIWTVEGEEVIVLGDTTTHGGKVITASSNIFYNNIPVARVGDQVTCPKCNGTHTIVSGASTVRGNSMQIARNGDNVSCGARLISRSGDVASDLSSFASVPLDGEFDECFQFICEDTGKPIVDMLYVIQLKGTVLFSGRTDEEGKTIRAYTEQAEMLEVFSGAEAMDILRRNA